MNVRRRIRLQKVLVMLFLTLVIGICFLGVAQLNDATETKMEKNQINPAAEIIQ